VAPAVRNASTISAIRAVAVEVKGVADCQAARKVSIMPRVASMKDANSATQIRIDPSASWPWACSRARAVTSSSLLR
jgi:hypothetical protein